jgi:hypothetical protein
LALSRDGFDDAVRLPPGLTVAHLRGATDFVEEKTEELIDLYFEQANVFSGIVGMFGVRALDSLSPYKRHKHPDVAQQRFPDLSLGGKLTPPPNEALESNPALARGRFSRTTIILDGISCGDTPSIRPSG